MDRASPVQATGRKSDQRNRAFAEIARTRLARDPMHALRPYRDSAFLARHAFEQREIELAAFEIALEGGALVGADVKPQARALAGARRQQLCKRSEERRVGKECRSRWSPY